MVTSAGTSEAVQALDASLNEDLEALRRDGLFRPLRVLESAQGPEVDIAGKAVISLSSNNYLGLNTHPRLVEAASRAALEWGAGTGAVRTIAGTQTLHEELERRLAAFKRTEASLTLVTCPKRPPVVMTLSPTLRAAWNSATLVCRRRIGMSTRT